MFFCKMKIDKHFDYDFFSFTQEGVMRKAKSTGHNLMQQIDFKMKRVFVIYSIHVREHSTPVFLS